MGPCLYGISRLLGSVTNETLTYFQHFFNKPIIVFSASLDTGQILYRDVYTCV